MGLLDNGDIIPSDPLSGNGRLWRAGRGAAYHNTRVKMYPGGVVAEIMVADKPIFRDPDWDPAPNKWQRWKAYKKAVETALTEDYETEYASAALGDCWEHQADDAAQASLLRSARRARTAVRDLIACNDLPVFVTLTLDPAKINRYRYDVIVQRLNAWLSNRVERKGLTYVVVPEYHKDGAIHFHGMLSDTLPMVNSGHKTKKRRVIYNLPDWTLGFTTAVRVPEKERERTRNYICKYITKQLDFRAGTPEKVGGRWYLSGGELQRPQYIYTDTDPAQATGRIIRVPGAGLTLRIA
jgi:hypothetical protein